MYINSSERKSVLTLMRYIHRNSVGGSQNEDTVVRIYQKYIAICTRRQWYLYQKLDEEGRGAMRGQHDGVTLTEAGAVTLGRTEQVWSLGKVGGRLCKSHQTEPTVNNTTEQFPRQEGRPNGNIAPEVRHSSVSEMRGKQNQSKDTEKVEMERSKGFRGPYQFPLDSGKQGHLPRVSK